MNTAKKSLIALLGVTAAVTCGTFLVAKINVRLKPVKGPPANAASTPSNVNRPFFYSSIGSSDPNIDTTHASQPVSKYTVNIKTFSTKSDAEALLKQLHDFGFFAYYTPVRQEGQVLYHVRLGIYSEEKDAERTLANLQRKTTMKGSVAQLQ